MQVLRMSPETALEQHTIPELAAALRNGSLSSRQLVDAAVDNQQLTPPESGAYIVWDPQQAREFADLADRELMAGRHRGALHGIPVSVKDIVGLHEFPVYAGGAYELPAKWRREGPVVKALRSEYCVFMGKTHTVQFAFGGLGINRIHGTPVNPFSRGGEHRVSGGSSIGAGLSLLERSAMLAVGTDTAGSVRIPASYTGNFGLKISHNRWSTAGIVPLCHQLDTPGILAKRCADLVAAFSTIDPHWTSCDQLYDHIDHLNNRTFRIGIPDNLLWSTAERGIAAACEQLLDTLAGHVEFEMVEVEFPEAQQAVNFRDTGGTSSLELSNFIKAELPDWLERLDPVVRDRISIADDIGQLEYERRVQLLDQYARHTPEAFDKCALIVCPTVPIAPVPIAAVEKLADYRRLNLLTLQNTCVANILNLCAISIPIGSGADGLPIGLQLMARHGNDELLLAAALKIEQLMT